MVAWLFLMGVPILFWSGRVSRNSAGQRIIKLIDRTIEEQVVSSGLALFAFRQQLCPLLSFYFSMKITGVTSCFEKYYIGTLNRLTGINFWSTCRMVTI